MSDTITFRFEGVGQVEWTVDHCRAVCPAETDAFLAAAQRCQEAMHHGTDQTRHDAGVSFHQCFQALEQAMFADARRRNPDPGAQVSSTAEKGEPA